MEDELNRLGTLPPPPQSPAAKALALSAAMQAFDEDAKNSRATQGSSFSQRQSSIINLIWSAVMNRKLLASSALATLLVVPAAGFVTFHFVRNNPELVAMLEKETAPIEEPVAGKLKAQEQAEIGKLAAEKPKTEVPVTSSVQTAEKKDVGEEADAVAPMSDAEQTVAGGAKPAEQPGLDGLVAAAPEMAQSGVASKRMLMSPTVSMDETVQMPQDDRNRFADTDNSPVKSVATEPVSTFSVDVDTASYSFVRRDLMGGVMPDPDSVRVEEMINYFPYDWAGPKDVSEPFKATVTVTPTPWNANTRLMHVGIKGYDVVQAQQPKANLVFLIDVSGSMDEETKLPLLKSAFRLLVDRLKPEDTVAIVTYAGNAGVVLEPTKASDSAAILNAIDTLQPGGSTAGAAGLNTAYQLAEKAFVKDGVNRVMLATDGDFNVGPSSDEDLKSLIETKRKSGVFLSVLGFGHDNYNDAMMQVLAQNGNGTAAFIDTLAEAQKTLVEEAGSSLFPIAKDVKIQVEFNPQKIAEYRLIGYETRALNREDFNNDKVDAGDIGSGHRVTAIYEITPVGSPAVLNDDLRYGKPKPSATTEVPSDELAFLKIRYKQPSEDISHLITTPVTEENAKATLAEASDDVRFSVAVAAFGQKLRDGQALSAYPFGSILDLATAAKGADAYGYRAEFLNLVRLAKSLSHQP